MSSFYSTFAAYMDNLCTDKGLKYYERSWEEFFGDLANVEFPCLLLDRHDFTFQDALSDNVMKKRQVAFIIASYVYDKTDRAAYRQQIDEAETKTDAVLNQMKRDSKLPQSTPIRGLNFEDIEAVSIDNEAVGAYGYSVVCVVETKHDIKI